MKKSINGKPRYPKPGTQKAIVLALLIAAQGKPVAVNILMRKAKAAATHSVIADLRAIGWEIKNSQKRVKGPDGHFITASKYWLVRPDQKGINQ